MRDLNGPQLDMTPDGRFIDPRKTPLSVKVLRWALIIAVVAGAASVAALALWFALILIPVIFVAGIVAYAAFRWRLWRAQNGVQRR